MEQTEIIQRMRSVEGHVRGIERMLDEDAYCIDVIRQIQAVNAALNRVSALILDRHLKSCVLTAVRGDDPGERERVLNEIAEIYATAKKS
jgi:CsoR family transcriptional regulator, copper-sensing transcriptional repressor